MPLPVDVGFDFPYNDPAQSIPWSRADEDACLAEADYWAEAWQSEDGRAAAQAIAARERAARKEETECRNTIR